MRFPPIPPKINPETYAHGREVIFLERKIVRRAIAMEKSEKK